MIRLRAHHLLCLEQFKGRGYSHTFIANFARVQQLLAQPGTEVQLVDGADAICSACPWLEGEACGLGEDACFRDRLVLAGLGIAPGTQISHQRLRDLFTSSFPLQRRLALCHGCAWLEDNVCYSAGKNEEVDRHKISQKQL